MRSSHDTPSSLVLQPRDLELLSIIHKHRFARSDHLHLLMQTTTSRRARQQRLKKLFTHGYVKRLYIPIILDGEHAPLTHSRQPIYTLSSRGLRFIKERGFIPETGLKWRAERPSVQFLAHHLIVTDCLVALRVASQSNGSVSLISGHAESLLRARLDAYRSEHRLTSAIVPDGVFTINYPTTGETLTFYLEVVRAEVRGGNKRLLDKYRRYSELHRQGFFKTVYGHEHIRAVLFLTTSTARAQNLATLARKLPHSRRLFWFGAYQKKAEGGRLTSLLTPENILTLPWQTPDGERLSLLQPEVPTKEVATAN